MSLFENFDTYIKTRSYAERISISHSGGISFNTTIVEKMGLNQYSYASFFYNKSNGFVGVKFSNQNTPDSYHFIPKKNADGKFAIYLSIKGFVMSYNIVPSGSIRKYVVENSEKDGGNLEVVLKPIKQEVETENKEKEELNQN